MAGADQRRPAAGRAEAGGADAEPGRDFAGDRIDRRGVGRGGLLQHRRDQRPVGEAAADAGGQGQAGEVAVQRGVAVGRVGQGVDRLGDQGQAAGPAAIQHPRHDRQRVGGLAADIKIRLDANWVSDQKSYLVWGTLPGATDETIYVIAHRDGFFDAADDNASGVASMLGLANFCENSEKPAPPHDRLHRHRRASPGQAGRLRP